MALREEIASSKTGGPRHCTPPAIRTRSGVPRSHGTTVPRPDMRSHNTPVWILSPAISIIVVIELHQETQIAFDCASKKEMNNLMKPARF